MGILRLYLAICVLCTHSESVLPWGTHSDREAVEIFFVISGFYTQFILSSGKYESVRTFYASRALRIFFPYAIALAIVVGASLAIGLRFGNWMSLSSTMRLEGNGFAGTMCALLANFTVFFQDWVMFLEHEPGHPLQFTSHFAFNRYPL